MNKLFPLEDRPGTIFTARVIQSAGTHPVVELFIEDREQPVGVIELEVLGIGTPEALVDQAFQEWVAGGFFRGTITDITLLFALVNAERERYQGVDGYLRTWRFLRAKGSTSEFPAFVLTTDKSDLPDRYQKILKYGLTKALKEEEAEREVRIKEDFDKAIREKELRNEYQDLIAEVARAAVQKVKVPEDKVRDLKELGLLEKTTTFRSGALFPGEAWTLWAEFSIEETPYAGRFGFDESLQLISIQQRLPSESEVYLGKVERRH